MKEYELKAIVQTINQRLLPNNNVIALDFAFFVPRNHQWDIKMYQYALQEYHTIFKEIYDKYKGVFAKFGDKTRVVQDLRKNYEAVNTNDLKYAAPNHKGAIINKEDFKIEQWHNDLREKKFGGASIVVSILQKPSTGLIAQAGAYLILKNPFGEFEKESKHTDINKLSEAKPHLQDAIKTIWGILEDKLDKKLSAILLERLKVKEIRRAPYMYFIDSPYLKEHLAIEQQILGHIRSTSKQTDSIRIVGECRRISLRLTRDLFLQLHNEYDKKSPAGNQNDITTIITLAYVYSLFISGEIQATLETIVNDDLPLKDFISAIEKSFDSLKPESSPSQIAEADRSIKSNALLTKTLDKFCFSTDIKGPSTFPQEECQKLYICFTVLFDQMYEQQMKYCNFYFRNRQFKIIYFDEKDKKAHIDWDTDFEDMVAPAANKNKGLEIILELIHSMDFALIHSRRVHHTTINGKAVRYFSYQIFPISASKKAS